MPYFGQWPFWMPCFLESCRRNPDIDWLFYTDCGEPPAVPPNVHIRHISFADYCRMVSEKLDIPFQPTAPYKLCDIRPAFGLIHADDIRDFDFWGWGDIDVVYGDLRQYFNESRLSAYDLLSTHSRRVSGHLCLFRNNQRMREAFLQLADWRELFTDPNHRAVDERAFSRIFVRHKNLPKPLRDFAMLFHPWSRRTEFREAYSTPLGRIPWTDGSRDYPSKWFWKEGRVSNDRDGERHFPYFHFVVWKKEDWTRIPPPDARTMSELAQRPAWVISADGFQGLEQ